MLTRRQLMSGIALGGLMAPVGLTSAVALTMEPMPKPLSDLAALRCTANIDNVSLTTTVPMAADHKDLLAKMQDLLRQKIAAGADPATAQEVAVCPLCGCPLTVTAQSSF